MKASPALRHASQLALALALIAPASASAQQRQRVDCQPGTSRTRQAGQTPAPPAGLEAYDVVVDIPDLCVERINLDVDNLDAHVSLNARVANLVRVNAGADVYIGTVELGIQGVRAEALLLVDLDNVVQVVDEVLTFIDNNPQVVSQLVGTVGNTVRTVGGVANTALQPGGVVGQTVGVVGQTLGNLTEPGGVLNETTNLLGQTVQTTLEAGGGLVEQTLDTAGNVVSSRNVGSLLQLPVLQETTNAAGQTVRQVRDTAGNLVEYTLSAPGRILNARILEAAGQQRR
jgi:YD repeat-containing protein